MRRARAFAVLLGQLGEVAALLDLVQHFLCAVRVVQDDHAGAEFVVAQGGDDGVVLRLDLLIGHGCRFDVVAQIRLGHGEGFCLLDRGLHIGMGVVMGFLRDLTEQFTGD